MNVTSRPQCIAACMNQSQSDCTGISFQDGDDPICLISTSSLTVGNGSSKVTHERSDQEASTMDRVCFSDLLTETWWRIRQTLEDGRTTVDLSARRLGSATHQLQVELLDGLPFVTTLDLSWNSLQSLQEDQFRGVENLVELDLHGNQLSVLPENVFSKLIHLGSLNLRDNNWRHIDSTLHYKPLAQPPVLRNIAIEKDNVLVNFDNPNDFHSNNDYQECGCAHYAIDTTASEHVIIRELYYDLGKLNDYLNTPSVKKVSIFAQTVVLKQTIPVSVHFDLEIVTREFWMDAQAAFQFDFHFVDTKLHGCDVWFSRSSLQTGSLTTVRYRYKTTYTVYIEAMTIHAPFTCHPDFGTIDDAIPGPDHHQLMTSTYCARQLMESVEKKLKTIRSSLPWKVMTYVKAVTSQVRLSHHENLNQSAAVANLATDQLIDWETARAKNIRTVPYLSSQALKEHLGLVKDLLETFDREWKHLENAQLHLDSRLIAAKIIIGKSKLSLVEREMDYNATVNQFQISVKTLAKIRSQYYFSVKVFIDAKGVFEEALQRLKVTQIIETIFNFGKALAAAASVGMAGNPAGAIKQVVLAIVTLIKDMVKLMNKLEKLFRITDLLARDVRNIDPKIYVDYADIEEMAELSTKVIVWKTMRTTAESFLSVQDFQHVKGYGQYRKSLLEVAQWGEALSREAIKHARLSTLVISKRYQVALLNSEWKKLQLVYQHAQKSHAITSELLLQTKFEAFNYQLLAIDSLETYCKSHFYYYMKECSTTIRPRLADSLNSIAIKIQQAKLLQFTVLSGMTCPVQSTNLRVSLVDQVPPDQCNSKICPVKQLKENRETLFEIRLDRPEFAKYQRIRIREIRIFLPGVMINNTRQELNIRISNDGAFQDRYRGSNYSFMSMPRSLTIRYRIGAGSFLEPGCIDGSHARYFSEMPPFSTWTIIVAKDSNPDLDLSNVTGIDIFFLAYATRADQCANFRGSGRKRLHSPGQSHDDLGESTISPECKRDFY
ncbi:uncharacterized protein LOC135492704 [Lineus longissimus]|uniref:uncharacterized protein LOC135492704 n=1 Tax=Lineus longissimus TaxID=88925 RepID=UPI00315DC177